jgi:hypothetical protein
VVKNVQIIITYGNFSTGPLVGVTGEEAKRFVLKRKNRAGIFKKGSIIPMKG